MSQYKQVLGPVALGDQFSLSFPLLQADGSAWTPTVSAAEFLLKRSVDDEDADALASKTLGAGITVTDSTATVVIQQADQAALTTTIVLHWALRITDATLGPVTVGAGTLKLERFAVRT